MFAFVDRRDLLSLAESCRRLRRLASDVSLWRKLALVPDGEHSTGPARHCDDAHVSRALSSPLFAGLRDVSFAGCAHITDASLAALQGACVRRLTHLNLGGCTGLTDEGVVALASQGAVLAELEHLDVSASRLTARALVAVHAVCSGTLRRLAPSDGPLMPPDGVAELLSRSPMFSVLDLTSTSGWTEHHVAVVRNASPRVQIRWLDVEQRVDTFMAQLLASLQNAATLLQNMVQIDEQGSMN